MAPSRPRRLLLSLITTAVIFGFAELIARSINPMFPRWGLPDTNAVIMVAHPTRLWGIAPGNRKNVDTTATVNDLGLRGDLVTVPRPAGEERIVILGDSTFFGHGVSDDDTMSAVLQARLTHTTVINGGIPGYSTEQTRRLLDEIIWDLEPTLLILGCFWSDNIYESYRDKDLFATREIQASTLLVHSAFMRWLATSLSGLRPSEDGRIVTWVHGGELPKATHRRVELADYVANLDWIIREAAKRNIGVILLSPPAKVEVIQSVAPPHQWGSYRDHQAAIALHHGIPHIDATLQFAADHKADPSPNADNLYLDDLHPSVRGHKLFAEIIDEGLKQAGWPSKPLLGTGAAIDTSSVVDTTSTGANRTTHARGQSPLMTMFLADKGAPGDPSRATPIGNTLPHRTEPFPITLVAPPDSGPFQIEVRSNGRSVASVRAAKPGTFPLTISVGALPVVITARDASGQEASQEVQDFSQPLKLTLP
jgi:lysophospholipase L1-like esterase